MGGQMLILIQMFLNKLNGGMMVAPLDLKGRSGPPLPSGKRTDEPACPATLSAAAKYAVNAFLRALTVLVLVLLSSLLLKAQDKEIQMEQKISYRTVKVDGLSIFYRKAGPKDAPTILLLPGLPSSSRMFQPLLTRLADKYHLVAPDYPGFGHSDWPDPKQFDYTFDHIAAVMVDFTQALGLSH